MQSPTLKSFSFFASLVACTFFFHGTGLAQGDLLITPRRVVFEGNKRSESLNLANIGKDSATYFISFIQFRMKPDGAFEKITEPDSGQYFADKNIRFFPRSVTLAPNEAQTVKMQVTKTSQLGSGEYRSHLYFRAVPKENPLGEKPPARDTGISVKLVPVFGISIAVIVRAGETSLNMHLSDLSFAVVKDSIPTVSMNLDRSGNISSYGNISIEHISPEGKITSVGIVKGLAVYTPTPTRHVQISLDNNAGVNYASGKLHVVYADQSPKPVTLAEEEITLH